MTKKFGFEHEKIFLSFFGLKEISLKNVYWTISVHKDLMLVFRVQYNFLTTDRKNPYVALLNPIPHMFFWH